ncbi:hypothetical protein [Paenibacillus curdlanolyticus]|uniref:hypothetical protein n=1 Tax=Paenibacillus curdlanolyticus TaxID=59840 RepID=UPI0002DF7D33|nr:hypothetical protein [Paenibacillus curdlanolyticus]
MFGTPPTVNAASGNAVELDVGAWYDSYVVSRELHLSVRSGVQDSGGNEIQLGYNNIQSQKQ